MNYQPPNQLNSPQTVLPTSTMAIISLIAGILGFFGLPVVGSIVAIVTGNMARKETRATPPSASGDGMATAGIVMGWIQLALAGCGICAAIAYVIFIIFIVGVTATSHHSMLPGLLAAL